MISVITSSYNTGPYLRRNIESVLSQSYENWEHIVIDCGSTDGSLEILAEMQHPRLKLMQVPLCGVARPRNLAIQQANGEFIAILDSDDAAYPNRLQQQVEIFKQYSDVVAVGAGVQTLNEATGKTGTYVYPRSHEALCLMLHSAFNPIPHSTLTFRRSAFDRVGGYLETMEKAEDFELLLRMLSVGRLMSLQEVLACYTIRKSSHSYMHKPMGRDLSNYGILSLIMHSVIGEKESLSQKKVQQWLDEITVEGTHALVGRWALHGLIRGWQLLGAGASYKLLKKFLVNAPMMFRSCRRDWWTYADTPDSIAEKLANEQHEVRE